MQAEAARGAAGIYPVDILEDDPERHLEATLGYYATLREGIRSSVEVFSLPTGEQIKLEASSVCFCTMYRDEPQHKILALVNPQDTKTGSLCGDGPGACYLLPVFDTVFVRRTYRRQGLGTAMLQDFCETFREDEALGVSWPISPAMFKVCRKFLLAHPEERGRLWEVEPPGAWGQRGSIWLKVQLQQSRLPDRHLRLLMPLSCLGRAAHPGNSQEDVSSCGRTSPDDGPRMSGREGGKKERTSGEREQTKSDEDCGVEEEAGQLGRACGAEPARKEAKRTVLDAGLAWESQKKHMRPAPNSQTPP
ncbi:protein FAM169B isoform X3 [Lynx canadensis]|uniref:protein FAM169B isoform X3 n=1 Tax=Lynx canadensis TaxID=61383 RepID=UPI0011B0B66A|nr:protein FAM169B isoform X3 [Lynx canadensis]